MKNSNKKQRDNVLDTIIGISKGWVMKPYLLFREQEVENAILNRIGLPAIHDLNSKIIGKGIMYTAGDQYSFTAQDPEVKKLFADKEQEIRAIIDRVETMTKMLKDEKFVSLFQDNNKRHLDAAIEIEKNQKNRNTWSKSERWNKELRYFFNSILPHLSKFISDNHLKGKTHEFFKIKQKMELFLEGMPMSNTFLRLTYARDDESPERDVKPNDIIDVAHLSGSVPYCDVVVMEKMFASLCKKSKLDKKYDCLVLNSLKKLDEIL